MSSRSAERGYAGADECLDGWAGWEAPDVPRSGYGKRPAVGRPYNESGLLAAEEDLAGEQMVAKPCIEALHVAVLPGATGAALRSGRVVCGVGGRPRLLAGRSSKTVPRRRVSDMAALAGRVQGSWNSSGPGAVPGSSAEHLASHFRALASVSGVPDFQTELRGVLDI